MNFEKYRNYFPITDRHTYLDHAGVGPVSTKVKESVDQFMQTALYEAGFSYDKWMERVHRTREISARLIGASSDEIAFVKNTSHGISLVASGIDWSSDDNMLVFEKEFPSNIYPWLNLQKRGVEIRFIKANENGEFCLSDIEKLTDNKTKIISLSSVQYSNGFKSDLESIGSFCRANNILFFVDAIQSLGVLPMDVSKYKIDFLAADGHKWMLAPEGTGIFYCSKEKSEIITPTILGWKSIMDESNYGNINFELKTNALKFEEGSLNTLGIYALGQAISLLLEAGIDDIGKKVQQTGEYVIENARKRGFEIVCPQDTNKRGGIISFSGNFDKQNLKDKLRENNIMVNYRGGAIRVSPHFYNNNQDIDRLFQSIDKII